MADESRGPDGQWKPGKSGNPSGKRQRHAPIATLVSKPRYRAIINSLVDKAEEGDVGAARELLSRIEPAVKRHEFSADNVREHLEEILDRWLDLIPEDRRAEAFALLADPEAPSDGSHADARPDLH